MDYPQHSFGLPGTLTRERQSVRWSVPDGRKAALLECYASVRSATPYAVRLRVLDNTNKTSQAIPIPCFASPGAQSATPPTFTAQNGDELLPVEAPRTWRVPLDAKDGVELELDPNNLPPNGVEVTVLAMLFLSPLET